MGKTSCAGSNRKFWKGILILLTILWMAMIFFFSAQLAQESANLSGSVGERVLEAVYPGFQELNETDQQVLIEQIDTVIRKSAHFAEYLVLGFLMGLNFRMLRKKARYLPLFPAILAGFLYACSDEIHQMFVPGRAGMVQDVILDTLGVTCGALLAVLPAWGRK